MTQMQEEAASLRLSLQLGVISVSDVVNWADSQILMLEEPEIQLIDVSLMAMAHRLDVMNVLGELAAPISPMDVADRVLADAHAAVLECPSFGRLLAKSLEHFWVESGYPQRFDECGALDDEYVLADQGIGTVEGALDRLLDFTGGFTRDPT